MSPLGFPGLQDFRRRTVRAPSNPVDKSTIVSIFPQSIDEKKPTIQPGRFVIPAGSYEAPSLLVVGPSSWWREIDEDQPLLEIVNGSIQVADSVVKDYCNGLLACDMDGSMPGLFYLPGDLSVEKIKKEYSKTLEEAKDKQISWYRALVRMADTLWARTNGNPLCIGDQMRLAARELALTAKDWMRDFQASEMIRCIACGALRNPNFPICGACHNVIDKALAERIGLSDLKSPSGATSNFLQ